MLRMRNWSIYTRSGTHLGDHVAFAPEVAFCEYMSRLGSSVKLDDLEHRHVYEGMEQITYGPNNYVLISPSSTFASSVRSAS